VHDNCGLNLWRLAFGGSFFSGAAFGVAVSPTASDAVVVPKILSIVNLAARFCVQMLPTDRPGKFTSAECLKKTVEWVTESCGSLRAIET
jgi:hypothetical protein